MPRLPTRSRPDAPAPRTGVREHVQAQALRRRVAHLASTGLAAEEIAAVEGIEAGEVDALLGDEAFARLVRAYEVLGARPDAERRATLVGIARFLIDEAIGTGHLRVALFVVREELRGRDAAETVADKLIRQRERPPSRPRRPRRPSPRRRGPTRPRTPPTAWPSAAAAT